MSEIVCEFINWQADSLQPCRPTIVEVFYEFLDKSISFNSGYPAVWSADGS